MHNYVLQLKPYLSPISIAANPGIDGGEGAQMMKDLTKKGVILMIDDRRMGIYVGLDQYLY